MTVVAFSPMLRGQCGRSDTNVVGKVWPYPVPCFEHNVVIFITMLLG
jgi:hypothetical protein